MMKPQDRSTTVIDTDKGLEISIQKQIQILHYQLLHDDINCLIDSEDSVSVRMLIFTRISCKASEQTILHIAHRPDSCGSMILSLNTEH